MSSKPAGTDHDRAAADRGLNVDLLPSSSGTPHSCALPPAACGLHALAYSMREILSPLSNGNGADE